MIGLGVVVGPIGRFGQKIQSRAEENAWSLKCFPQKHENLT